MESDQARAIPNSQTGEVAGTKAGFWHHLSFRAAASRRHEMQSVASCLPTELHTKSFKGQHEIERLWTSYKAHGYGHFFYWLTRVLKPSLCVEIGVLQGFSLLTVASALRDNGSGNIDGFDLFEDYPYHHDKYAKVTERIESLGLRPWATAHCADAMDVHKSFDTVDYLHVDISNNGNTYREIFEQWAGKVKKVILLEGGSPHRDQVEWMIQYNKPPICPALDEIRDGYPNWDIFVLDPFPSLTVAIPAALTGT